MPTHFLLLNYFEIKRSSFKFGDLKMNHFIVFEVSSLQFSSFSLNKRTKKDPSTSKIGGHGNSSSFLPAHFLLHISLPARGIEI